MHLGAKQQPILQPLGDCAILVVLGDTISRELTSRVVYVGSRITEAKLPGVTDVVTSYASIAVFYDGGTSYDALSDALTPLLRETTGRGVEQESLHGKLHIIPVHYGGEDLDAVQRHTQLSLDEIALMHSSREYFVYVLGFVPGFAYLGDLDERLRVPRRAMPRTRVPAGAVAIAELQTAVYPFSTPGGWNIIGTTSTRVFDISRTPPALLRPGDRVLFEPLKS